MIHLFSFLGNPGSQYRKTRHNFAWLVLENCSFFPDLSWKSKFKSDTALLEYPGENRKVFLKPKTFMNNSGECVQEAAGYYKIPPAEILVVHDDVELPFGRFALRLGGGLAGHNGLRSVAERLGTREFYRLRLGVGRPARGDTASYVLGRFSPQEEAEMEDVFAGTGRLLTALLDNGPESLAPGNGGRP